LIHELDTEASKLLGNKIGFSQPIQMRFNELIAGVREDLAVKVFGDDFGPMLRVAGRIASILRGVEGAKNVKIEEVAGLPFLDIKIDKGEIARHGLSLSAFRMSLALPSADAQPAWCSKATAGSRSLCVYPMRCATMSIRWKICR